MNQLFLTYIKLFVPIPFLKECLSDLRCTVTTLLRDLRILNRCESQCIIRNGNGIGPFYQFLDFWFVSDKSKTPCPFSTTSITPNTMLAHRFVKSCFKHFLIWTFSVSKSSTSVTSNNCKLVSKNVFLFIRKHFLLLRTCCSLGTAILLHARIGISCSFFLCFQ
eukprot:TRINITY_DN2179_c0_g2_i1.p1 TRINITY_DN2179_c0_g2~~TRINITY_DN2179_c0_g2_i1.p1  ORF type:complete len:164 (-),score=2.61 TRINITY_DN2179_c0_g2_i1:24-515(-)